jgi:hypothetical protein
MSIAEDSYQLFALVESTYHTDRIYCRFDQRKPLVDQARLDSIIDHDVAHPNRHHSFVLALEV